MAALPPCNQKTVSVQRFISVLFICLTCTIQIVSCFDSEKKSIIFSTWQIILKERLNFVPIQLLIFSCRGKKGFCNNWSFCPLIPFHLGHGILV